MPLNTATENDSASKMHLCQSAKKETQKLLEWNYMENGYNYGCVSFLGSTIIEGLRERTEYIDIFLFSPITQSCSVSNVMFTDGRGVSDFSVLKYY